MVSDTTVSSQDFAGLSLANKALFFNSCQVHNSPLEPAIRGAGVQKYIGGDTDLAIGFSEEVFKCWFNAVVGGTGMTPALSQCGNSIAGRFGISVKRG